MRLLVGTSGYSYKEWKGSFYPEDLPAKDFLRYYGSRFGTVEINNTFYRMPTESMLSHWAEEVPETFAFVLKAPRRITHEMKLANTEDPLSYLMKTASVLGGKLGPILFQLPPFLRKDVSKLRDFLALIPEGRRAAFEFRHASWFDDEVYDALRARGASLCLADADNELDIPFLATAPWGYLRLRREGYGDEDLRAWVDRVRGQEWDDAYVFFKHEEAGTGPKLAARFLELAG